MLVFFGHQSVGANVLDGLAAAGGWRIVRAVDYRDSAEPTIPTVIHEPMGANRDPQSKLTDFSAWLDGGRLPAVDVALLKFCYVDVTSADAADQLWPLYQARLDQLAQQHSNVRFAHCTIPLRRLPAGPYAFMRRMLGHKHPELAANRARERFNERLRTSYGSQLFDLAALEATRDDGRRCEQAGVPGLAPEWTNDGGHLNESGRTMAAASFVNFLQTLAPGKSR